MAQTIVTEITAETIEKVRFFHDRSREQGYGDGHFLFACQAAFPIAFTPDLLYQLWANFSEFTNAQGQMGKSDLMAISDLLLSNLCRRVEQDVFEMEEEVRAHLLQHLRNQPHLGDQRIRHLAAFLFQYAQSSTNEDYPEAYREAQYWTALITIAPEKAAMEISSALSRHVRQENQADILRMRNLLESYTNLDNRFEGLLHFSKGLKAALYQMPADVVQEQFDRAKVLSITQDTTPGEGVLQLPILDRLKGQIRLQPLEEEASSEVLRRIKAAAASQAEKLDLSQLGLTELPPELFDLSPLKSLDLSQNQLSSLEGDWPQLRQLTTLRLSGNQLTQLPPTFRNLPSLKELLLDQNAFEKIPLHIPTDTLLQLSLNENRIEQITPEEVTVFHHETTLQLHGNAISDYGVIHAAEKGVAILRAYFEPVIFLGFNNQANAPLATLERESRSITEALDPGVDRGQYQLFREDYLDLESIIGTLTRLQNQLLLFHYSGQQTKEQTKLLKEIADSEDLIQILLTQQNLKLIFLNTVQTKRQVKQIMSLGIPAVIAPSTALRDEDAVNFSNHFYRALARGETIQEAFDSASNDINLPASSFIRSKKSSEKAGEPPYTLTINNEWIADWKLPRPTNGPDSAIEWNAGERFNFKNQPPNDRLLSDLGEALGVYHEEIQEVLNQKVLNARLMQRAIIDCFPSPVGERFRRLLATEKFELADHLANLAAIYNTLVRYLNVVLLAQLWEFKLQSANTKQPDQLLPDTTRRLIRAFLQPTTGSEQESDPTALTQALLEVLSSNGQSAEALVREWPALSKTFQQEEAFRQAGLFLNELQQLLQEGSIPQEEMESLCVQAEIQLGVFLAKTGFLTRYPLVSVKEIEVVKPYFGEVRFRHKMVYLDKITTGYLDQEKDFDQFTDTQSVLLLRDKEEIGRYLNLSPFLIDEHALSGQSRARLLFLFSADKEITFQDAFSDRTEILDAPTFSSQLKVFEQLFLENRQD